ncbi:MAG: proline--tRNA ligase [Nanoarchaeota archaeon]|nr:proline--tRNA ligase [Nanoarchaeota archaeon]
MNKESKQGLTVKKTENFSEWYTQVIEKAEITDIRLGIKGFITIRPWGAMIMENMFQMYERELQKNGHLPVIMPSVIPESNLKREASHIFGFTPQVFWIEAEKGEERLALRPTSETVFTPMFALWIRSHRDLPMKLYQKGSVFRYDTKATRPLIRGREFQWIECHDAFATKEEAIKQTGEDIDTTEKVMHQKFGVPFLAMKRPEWDKFPGAEYTIGSDVFMPDGKLIQQPSTHMMGQKFSRAFGATFKDEQGKENYLYTTAYGPAISRILVSVISLHGDDKGLVIPYCISPVKAVIIPIYDAKNKSKVLKYCKEINSKLNELGIQNWLNNKEGYSPGWKFYESELKGIPFRLEIGEKEMKSKSATLFTRDTGKKEKLSIKSLSKLKNLGQDYDKRLLKKADNLMGNKIANCRTKEEIKKALNSGKIAKVNFCSVDKSGEKCAERVEKELGAEVRGTLANKNEKPSGNCVICNTHANAVVYIAKSY